MKKIIIAIFCILAAVACEKPAPVVEEPQLNISFTNVAGEWELSKWKGSDVESGSVVVKLGKDKKFVLTQTVGSMYPTEYTGEFNLVEEFGVGTTIRGMYDYTYEFWEHQYYVTSLTASRMEWTSADDPEDVYLYIRVK